jgi:hypothetical protein
VAVLKYHDGTGWEPVASALQGPTGPTGVAVGLPTGGATGASLIKSSSTDYATEWSSNVGGLVLINTTTIGTSVSSIAVDNVFSSAYKNYRIVFNTDGATNTNNTTASLRLRASTTPDSSSNYSSRGSSTTSSALNSLILTSQTSWVFHNFTSGNTQESHSYIEMFKPFTAAFTHAWFNQFRNNAGSFESSQFFSLHTAATSYDGFEINITTGSITGGTISVYGYKD